MARGRMLDQAFVKSHKLRECTRDTRLAYAMILPFLDREGRHVAEPFVLKALVFRWSDFSMEEVAACVAELERVGLIRLYGDEDNAAILEYVDFAKHNKPNAKEAKSALPGPDDPTVGPCRDDLLTAAQAAHGQSTADARAMHGQPTSNTDAAPVENVNVNVNENVNGRTHSSPELARVDSRPALAATPPRTRLDHQLFVDVWNQHRGRLPAVLQLNDKRRTLIAKLVKEHGEDVAAALLRDATRAVASDDYWLEKQYGLDNLLTGGKVLARAEQWRNGAMQLGAANTRLAQTAASVASAIGALDDRPN